MKAAHLFHTHLEALGYSTIEVDYVFSDVFAPTKRDCTVPLAAFTHGPPSYRNAALAVVEAEQGATELADDYRALGAPLLFVIQGDEVSIWKVHGEGRHTLLRKEPLSNLGSLFRENKDNWSPRRIHDAKSFGLLSKGYQLDFVDLGLLPAIEGVIHTKLNRLLTETLADTVRLRAIRPGEKVNERLIFRTVFRLLAAKVLQDREHELSSQWDAADIDTVLQGISGYYKLPKLPGEAGSFKGTVFDSAWARLRGGINFRNISSDDLAFIYENTLITDETRKHFGTHSTPRAVAEYVVRRIEFWQAGSHDMKVYEPFAGAGVFMVAALRQLRDLLPVNLSELERHRLLVDRIAGDEIDPFATEVAMLSLILADYPNENGWAISTVDLFKDYVLPERAHGADVILCNPPFERFEAEERTLYPEAYARSPYKPIAALAGALDTRPRALGFVLPEPFINGTQYAPQRKRIEEIYKDIEVVALPDNVFKASVVRSSLLIAREARAEGDTETTLHSTWIAQKDRKRFLKTGDVTGTRTRERAFGRSTGTLWVEELEEIWEYFSDLPTLDSVAKTHMGVKWRTGQSNAISRDFREGSRLGIHPANAVHAFSLARPMYLDWQPKNFALRTAAQRRDWDSPKIIANAARLSRGPWCFAAGVDRGRLAASQQLFGIWPRGDVGLDTLCAILNSPVAVAYLASHSPPDRIRIEAVNAMPIPRELPASLSDLVQRYVAMIGDGGALVNEEAAIEALYHLDAAVLQAYDLPPRLERQLLEYFRGEARPTVHAWRHWLPDNFQPFIPLHEYLSEEYRRTTTPWIQHVFAPLPPDEATGLREFMD